MKLSEQIKKHLDEKHDLEEKLTHFLELIMEVRYDLDLDYVYPPLEFDDSEELSDFYIYGDSIHLSLSYIDPFDDWDTHSDVVFPLSWLDMTEEETKKEIHKTFIEYNSQEEVRLLERLKLQAIEAGLIKE